MTTFCECHSEPKDSTDKGKYNLPTESEMLEVDDFITDELSLIGNKSTNIDIRLRKQRGYTDGFVNGFKQGLYEIYGKVHHTFVISSSEDDIIGYTDGYKDGHHWGKGVGESKKHMNTKFNTVEKNIQYETIFYLSLQYIRENTN